MQFRRTYIACHGCFNITVMERSKNKKVITENLIEEYELCLIKLYGSIIGGKDLRHILGYKTGDAFRKSVQRKTLPIPTFIPEGRRERVARTHDIAIWLVSLDADN